jgi:hypothetical protein
MPKPQKEILLEQERCELKTKSGGGLLSYEVWGYQENSRTVVTRYNLAYTTMPFIQATMVASLVSTMPMDTTIGTIWG